MFRRPERALIRLARSLVAAALLSAVSVVQASAFDGTLEVVGHTDLGARGLTGGLAVAGSCAYVGSRDSGPVTILDISDPSRPQRVGELAGRARTTHRELRADPGGHWLAVLDYSLGSGGANQLAFYSWTTNCLALTPTGSFSFGARPPHEMYLWQDHARPGRVLLFVTMFSGGAGDLQVIDASNPSAPALLTSWPAATALPGPLHSISLSDDGRTAYLADWTGGLLVADSSDFAAGVPNPQLRLLTAPGSAYRTPPGNVHSAVPVPGLPLAVVTDERYPAPGGIGCPYGPAHTVDISDPARPRAAGTLAIPENNPSVCAGAPPGTWTSHNPTLTAGLALVSWYSGGVEIFDISRPDAPQRLAELRPSDSRPRLADPGLGSTATMAWSYPIVKDGLIYVADINQGLYVLRYRGPHEDDLRALAFSEGNSNLARTVAMPSPTPSPAPAPSIRITARAPTPAGSRGLSVPFAPLVALLGVLSVAAVGLALLRRRSRQEPRR